MNQAFAENRRTLRKLLVIAVGMFAFGYALVPFYEKICQVTGIRDLLRPDEVAKNTQVDRSRNITIEFDANLHNLAWTFKPLQASVTAHPGEIVQVMYEISNTRDQPVVGQAIPSYGPALAAQYFRKMECFCFSKQTLGPHETRTMPVVFVLDPALPGEVNTITLSYTFFEVAGASAAKAGAPGG